MKFLKSASVSGSKFSAKFMNGETTSSRTVAAFFMKMQDKAAGADELDGYIRLGVMIDPAQDWTEIKRIAASFKPKAAKD